MKLTQRLKLLLSNDVFLNVESDCEGFRIVTYTNDSEEPSAPPIFLNTDEAEALVQMLQLGIKHQKDYK